MGNRKNRAAWKPPRVAKNQVGGDSLGSRHLKQQIQNEAAKGSPTTLSRKQIRIRQQPSTFQPPSNEPSAIDTLIAREKIDAGTFPYYYPVVLLGGIEAWDNKHYFAGSPDCPVCRGQKLKPGHYCLRCDNCRMKGVD